MLPTHAENWHFEEDFAGSPRKRAGEHVLNRHQQDEIFARIARPGNTLAAG
jgi:hypothetical protein